MWADSVLLPMFLAGVLTGMGVAILASVARDSTASIRSIVRALRQRRFRR